MNSFDTNIGKADLDPIKDTDGKDDFTEGVEYDSELKKAPPTKYDSVAEAFLVEDGFFKKIGSAITQTVAGRTTVGRVLGIGLDVATFVFPYGSKIDKIRKTTKTLLGLDQRKFKYQPNKGNMKLLKEIKRRLSQPAGKAVLTVLVAIAGFFGAHIGVAELGANLSAVLQGIIGAIGGAVALYHMFRDEDAQAQ